MSQQWREISRHDTNLKEIDVGIKNCFRWGWLEEKDSNGHYLSDYIRKINIPGKVSCTYCNSLLSYKSGGKKDLKNHAKNKKHMEVIKLKKTNTTLPSTFNLNPSSEALTSSCSLPYGTAPNIHDGQACHSKRKDPLPRIVSFEDRKAHNEAFIVSFMAEHSLPFTLAPHLIRFTQELSKDTRALQSTSMARTTASYKLREGLAATLSDDIVEELKSSFFSFNVDECMSNAHQKIFSIIVTYFSEELQRVVIHHYNSKPFIIVNAVNLFTHVKATLLNDGIPLSNLISNLSDSTNYMRGKVAGFETLLRKEVPHLLNIDGDTCHHAHNSVKKFISPFKKYIEQLLTDIRTDMLWSTDIRQYLAEICEFLNISYRMPADRVDHRWLSVYDASVVDLPLFPALTVLYYAWMPSEYRATYKDVIDTLLQVSVDIYLIKI